jgi:hypothetical protein
MLLGAGKGNQNCSGITDFRFQGPRALVTATVRAMAFATWRPDAASASPDFTARTVSVS